MALIGVLTFIELINAVVPILNFINALLTVNTLSVTVFRIFYKALNYNMPYVEYTIAPVFKINLIKRSLL